MYLTDKKLKKNLKNKLLKKLHIYHINLPVRTKGTLALNETIAHFKNKA